MQSATEAAQVQPTQTEHSPRACEECKRKKTKCDMRKPMCLACVKSETPCVYPTRRKKPVYRSNVEKRKSTTQNSLEDIGRLLRDLDDDTLQRLISARSPQSVNDNNASGLQHMPEPGTSKSPLPHSEPSVSPLLDVNAPEQGLQINFNDPAITASGSENGAFQQASYDAPYSELWFNGNQMDHFGSNSMTDLYTMRTLGNPRQLFGGPIDLYSINSASPSRQDMFLPSGGQQEVDTQTGDCASSSQVDPKYSLHVSADVAEHLIELFFDKIQCSLPLFHRPRFYARYVKQDLAPRHRYEDLSLESALLLNSMFALSARFSTLDIWKASPKHRGDHFALESRNLYEEARRARETDTPPFEYLQGVLLHTYYLFASRPCTRAWVMAGVCSRLAYDQGLHNVDKDMISGNSTAYLSTDEWVEREEQRRLWWAIWEVDTFASTLSCRPYNIDQNRIHVLLPVSDEALFSNTMVSSAPMAAEPTAMWSSLQYSENQDERAWFLVSRGLMRLAHEAVQSSTISLTRNQDIQTAISCFALILPPKFHLSSGSLPYDDLTFSKSNWTVSTVLTLQEAGIHAAFLKTEDNSTDTFGLPIESNHEDFNDVYFKKCQRYIKDSIRAAQAFSPEYIPLASPFIMCSLIGPSSMNLASNKITSSNITNTGKASGMNSEVLILCLKQFNRYWNIASLLLEFLQCFVHHNPPAPASISPQERELASNFVVLMPNRL